MRKALAEILIDTIKNDSSIIFLTGDLGFGVFDELKINFPSNYLNVGIAESNMIAMAAGLAAKGLKPVVYSIASFISSRPYEFTKILAGYNEFPIIFVGAGGGLTYSTSGGTHHSLDDIKLMLGIPGIEVYTPSGPIELKNSFQRALSANKSAYIRIGKFGENDLIDYEYESSPIELIKGTTIAILSYGNLSEHCMKVSKKINKIYQSKVGFYHFPYIQNLDWSEILEKLSSYQFVIVIEEHWPIGGLYSMVLHNIVNNNARFEVHRLGPPFRFIDEHDRHEELQEKLGYGPNHIELFVSNLLKREDIN